MGRYVWSDDAGRDLKDVYDYVAGRDVGAADRLMDEMDRKAGIYATNPLLGEARPDLSPAARAFRVGKYLVIYRPLQEGILVARVVHSARDVQRLFEEP